MAKTAGRDLLIKKGGTTIAGARVSGMSFNGTPIDISDNQDGAAITYLANEFSETTLEFTLAGLEDGQVLRDLFLGAADSGRHPSDLTLVFPNTDEISGNFILSSYTETGEYRDAVTFDATMIRNGAHTYTPV